MMNEWILIFWLYLGKGGAATSVPGFEGLNACTNAGEAIVNARDLPRNYKHYVCVPRKV